MGQKVNPNGMRLGINKQWSSKWYQERGGVAKILLSDFKIRKFLEKKLQDAGISRIDIERPARDAKVTIYACRPGVIIGKGGREIESLRQAVSHQVGVPVYINIEEVRKPEIDANLVASNIAQQLVKRMAFRRTIKRAVTSALRCGAKGIKVCISGRLGGAEIARSEWCREGRIPLHTFRADIDYGVASANTTYGVIGVKVWIYRGEVFTNQQNFHSKAGKDVATGSLKTKEQM